MKKQNKKKKQNQQNDQNQSNPNDVGHDTHTFWDEDIEKQNDETIKKCNNADICVVGSYITKQDYKEAIRKLRD